MDIQELVDAGVFNLDTLTAQINSLPATSTRIANSKLFQEEGVDSDIILIARTADKLTLVPSAPRGAPAQPKGLASRNAMPFQIPHLPQRSTLMAASLVGAKVLGSNDPNAGVTQKLKALQAVHRRDNDYTIEYHRLGAIKGQILDADGSVMFDFFDEFGVEQIEYDMALSNNATKVRVKAVGAKRLIEKELGDVPYSGLISWCSPEFFDKFVSHPDVEKAYDRFQDGKQLRDDVRAGFDFAGINWSEMNWAVRGGSAIAAGEAYLIPLGVPDMFITRFGPADYMETIGSVGLPYYSKGEPLPFNKGVQIESQSNPINVNTRPRAVIKLKV